jgi:steroid delta-isomerase
MASNEAIQQAVTAYFGAIGRLGANAVAEAFAPNGVSNDPAGTPPHAGRDAVRQFMLGRLGAAEQLAFTADHIFVAGDTAAVKWTARLTAKNGRSVTVEGIDVFAVNDQGEIQTLDAYWDPAPVMTVLQGSTA